MLFKSFTASLFLLALTSSVNAQEEEGCAISPAMGVSGTPGASDIQQPSDDAPCGNVNITQNLDTSEAVQADSNGQFKVSVIGFGAGTENSRNIATVKVDGSGKGTDFITATMVANGEARPATAGTEQLTVQLPNGITCGGGSSGNLCVASFISTGGSGNCVVIKQPAGNIVKRSDPQDMGQPKPSPEPIPPKSHKSKQPPGNNVKRSDPQDKGQPKPSPNQFHPRAPSSSSRRRM
ncbi:hypothetical protein BGY98DRAFT_1117941 [Russula aff. rugulosa BPL654]|nr:hypothetical protein BGY98DRAFT_1117941 [Russula aff. rugulosa BPL654]